MLTKEKETSYLDKGFVHSLNVFFLFVSLSLTHTSVILLSFVLQRKGRVRLCWVLQSSQDKSSASTDKKTRQFSLKTGILHWKKKKKKLHKTCLLLAVSLFFFKISCSWTDACLAFKSIRIFISQTPKSTLHSRHCSCPE